VIRAGCYITVDGNPTIYGNGPTTEVSKTSYGAASSLSAAFDHG
jgi:hypothetical protein